MCGKGKDPDVSDLLPSIRARGVLVPLLVCPNYSEGRYEIVAGRRRFTAVNAVARQGGAVKSIPCAILDDGDMPMRSKRRCWKILRGATPLRPVPPA